MPSDDMHLIICKILGYIYYCNRNDIKVEEKDIMHKSNLYNIHYGYWCQILNELHKNGYIEGFEIVKDMSSSMANVLIIDPRITSIGVDYFNNNKAIKKARNYLKEIKSTLPFV